MEDEWCRNYLSQHGMPVARYVKFALASTSDRPLPKNVMTLVVSHTWQNFHVDNTSVHVTRSPTYGNLAVLSRNNNIHAPTRYNQPAEAYCGGTGVTSVRQLRSTCFSAPTMIGSATSVRRLLMTMSMNNPAQARTQPLSSHLRDP